MDDQLSCREQLLEKYAELEPQAFVQFYGFASLEADSLERTDRDGHALFSSYTHELMGGPEVRVLVLSGTPKKHALALLEKITKWVRRWPDDNINEDHFDRVGSRYCDPPSGIAQSSN